MEKIIVTTESSLMEIIEKIFDKKMPKTTESELERTFSINDA